MAEQEHVLTLFARFSHDPDATAVLADDAASTYGELDVEARRFAARLLGGGVVPGDRVAVLAAPSARVISCVLGAHRAAAVCVPINTRYRDRELAHILADSDPAAVIVDDDPDRTAMLDRVAPGLRRIGLDDRDLPAPAAGPPLPDDDDTALIIYTSGTTGPSKGAELSYRAVVSNMLALAGVWNWTAQDRLVLALPLYHVHGLCLGIHGAFVRGMSIVLQRSFDPQAVVAAFRDRNASVFMGVPTMYRRLLQHLADNPKDCEALARGRLFTAGSAALPAADFAAFERLTGHRIAERYGMTETLITLANPCDGERRPGSVGVPVPGVEARVVDEVGRAVTDGALGELEVRGPGLMTGYFRNPEATGACWRDGWFRTGDVAVRDPDGYVRIVGRTSVDIVKTGGFRVSAREIEEVLETHPEVEEVAVVGCADERWGERIVAAVVRAEVDEPERDLGDALAKFVAERLADYKKPREVVVVGELPRNAMGKPQKHRIRQLLTTRATGGG
jgi:acyl-CoA synthetase (AMP-forming)/AMP-acid ligase II